MLPKIIVIVGPTASGKSSLAVRLAKKTDGEIVSADSRLLYRGMDIGTAKPERDVRRTKSYGANRFTGRLYLSEGIPHHLIDVASVSETLTLSDYKKKALKAIRSILKRGKTPILVGGTGLYVRAIVENLEIPEVPPDPAYRQFLERKGKKWILDRLKKIDPEYAARVGPNPRRAIRALEVFKATGRAFSAQQGRGAKLFDALMIGLDPGKGVLEGRIRRRTRKMLSMGLLSEVRRLRRTTAKKKSNALDTAIGYRELFPVLNGEKTLKEGLEEIIVNTKRYAKRQMTWWRAMKEIEWFNQPNPALYRAVFWLKSAK
jgi:tRNA dimethylallyltransferase